MKTIEVKRQLLEEILDQLKGAQNDCYVLSTANVIDELEVVLRQPDVIKSVCFTKKPCTCKRALEADGFIDCDNSCKQTVL